MLIRNYKSSRDLFLKIKRSAEVLSLKDSKKIIPLSGKKLETRNFKFNQSVEARFDSAISAIEKKKLDKAKTELEEGKKLLSERQKLIK